MSSTAAEAAGAAPARVAAAAARLGLAIDIVCIEAGTRTAEDAARACGCALDQIVKSLVFRVEDDGRPVLLLTAGGNRVDPAKAAGLVGGRLVKADAAAVRAHTGFAIGGVAPIGHLQPLETWFDPRLLGFDTVWAAAGTPRHVFAVAPRALCAATGARVADFTA